jgi:hypothetical protein
MLLTADAAAMYYNGNVSVVYSKPSTVVSADGSLCRYPSTTFLNQRGLAMLLKADAAAKYYNGNVSVA